MIVVTSLTGEIEDAVMGQISYDGVSFLLLGCGVTGCCSSDGAAAMGDNTGDGDSGKPESCSLFMTGTVCEGVSSVASFMEQW